MEDDDGQYIGKYANLWVRYTRILFEVHTAEKLKVLTTEAKRYFLFMICFCVYLLLQNRVALRFETEQALKSEFIRAEFPHSPNSNLFITFKDISSTEQFWQWSNEILFEELYVQGHQSNWTTSDYNQLLWGVRFNQKRVKKGLDCNLPDVVRQSKIVQLLPCYPEYSEETKATTGAGDGYGQKINATIQGSDGRERHTIVHEYNWTQAGITQDVQISGALSSYGGDGFVRELPLNYTRAKELMNQMQDATFPYVDQYTRAVVISFTTYNLNNNMFARSQFLAEFGASGNVAVRPSFEVFEILPPSQTSSSESLAGLFNVFFCMGIAAYIIAFLGDLRTGVHRLQLWHIPELISYVIFCFHLYLAIRDGVFRQNETSLSQALASPNFYSTANMMSWQAFIQEMYAINMIFCIVRIFKYLQLSSGLMIVFGTLQRASKDIVFFFGLFAMNFIGFLLCGYIVFGPHLDDFESISRAISTLSRMVLGDFEYGALREANEDFAPFYFSTFMILFFFLLVNIFLAILLDAWRLESERVARMYEKGESVELLRGWQKMLRNMWRGLFNPAKWASAVLYFLGSPDGTFSGLMKNLKGISGDMPVEEALQRLQEWKDMRRNRSTIFMNFKMVHQALIGGVRNKKEVKNAEVHRLFELVERAGIAANTDYLKTEDEKETEEQAEADEEELVNDATLHMSSLKRLFVAFKLLKDSQNRAMGNLEGKLSNLQNLQNTTFAKVKYLQRRMDDLIPEIGS